MRLCVHGTTHIIWAISGMADRPRPRQDSVTESGSWILLIVEFNRELEKI